MKIDACLSKIWRNSLPKRSPEGSYTSTNYPSLFGGKTLTAYVCAMILLYFSDASLPVDVCGPF